MSRQHRPLEFLKKTGNRIRSRRLHCGMPQREAAKQAGISISTYVNYENGHGHPPAATLHRIAKALGTNSSKLMGEHEREDVHQVFDDISELYSHPTIGAVTRYMQCMSSQDLLTLQVIAAALAHRELRRSKGVVEKDQNLRVTDDEAVI
jgi:transcriptional regulator with XRE-family HTH domain